MSRNELIAKIEALNEWEAMMEEAKTEAEAIRSSIKAEMEERGPIIQRASLQKREHEEHEENEERHGDTSFLG